MQQLQEKHDSDGRIKTIRTQFSDAFSKLNKIRAVNK